MKKNRVTVIVAAHKKYNMPSDSMYLPLHVGAEGKKDENGNELDLGYTKDNTGENISSKNPFFCELTGMYWAWKNIDSDYIGVVHYRRHFSLNWRLGWNSDGVYGKILTSEELEPLLEKYKIIVPKRRNYYIETMYSHYAHTHYAEHLDETEKIISEMYPEYLGSYTRTVNRSSAHMFNMMIMSRELFDDYCSWVFDILFELEKRISAQSAGLSPFHSRFYGRVSEIIFNAWLDQKIRTGEIDRSQVKELPYIHTEKIDMKRKVISFIKAKYAHKKYEASF